MHTLLLSRWKGNSADRELYETRFSVFSAYKTRMTIVRRNPHCYDILYARTLAAALSCRTWFKGNDFEVGAKKRGEPLWRATPSVSCRKAIADERPAKRARPVGSLFNVYGSFFTASPEPRRHFVFRRHRRPLVPYYAHLRTPYACRATRT